MKIKLDENIPHRLVEVLKPLGHDVDTVFQEGLMGKKDHQVWQAAQKEKRFLVTQDLDFSDVRRFMPGTHYGILLLRLRSPGNNSIIQRIQSIFQTETVEEWKGCFVVVTERKIRIRSPDNQQQPS